MIRVINKTSTIHKATYSTSISNFTFNNIELLHSLESLHILLLFFAGDLGFAKLRKIS